MRGKDYNKFFSIAEVMTIVDSKVNTMVEVKGSIKKIFSRKGRKLNILFAPNSGEPFLANIIIHVPRKGLELILKGNWIKTNNGAPLLDVIEYEIPEYQDIEGIKRWLRTNVKGIGPAMANNLVNTLGEKTIEKIITNSNVLNEVPGVSTSKKQAILKKIQENDYRKIEGKLANYGLSPLQMLTIHNRWKDKAVDKIFKNPYLLIDDKFIDSRFDFSVPDLIAKTQGYPQRWPERIQAAIKYTLMQYSNNGHCFAYCDTLIRRTLALLNKDSDVKIEPEEVNLEIEILEKKNLLYKKGKRIYAHYTWWPEIDSTIHIKRLVYATDVPGGLEEIINQFNDSEKNTLDNYQRSAIKFFWANNFCIISGGPGTGKSHLVRAILYTIQKIHPQWTVTLTATTGHAAERLSEMTGFSVQTLHSTLGIGIDNEDDQLTYNIDKNKTLETDVLFIEESSMMDIILFNKALKALSPHTKVVLIGDHNQIPSVGPGRVLADLINGGVPTTFLKINHRQESKLIIENAQKVLYGETLDPERDTGSGFHFIEAPPELLQAKLIKQIEDLGKNPFDIQILCPRKDGPAGIYELNRILHEVYNPGTGEYRPGDKVIHCHRNRKEVKNGDSGIVSAVKYVDDNLDEITVKFRNSVVNYNWFTAGEELEHAYALTMHKGQGSQYKVVILPLLPEHKDINVNLLYTAITRAQQELYIIGTWDALSNPKRRKERRNSMLAYRIKKVRFNKF